MLRNQACSYSHRQVHAWTAVHARMCMWIRIYAHTHTGMDLWVYSCVYTYMYVMCLWITMHSHTHTGMHLYAHLCAHICEWIMMYVHTQTCIATVHVPGFITLVYKNHVHLCTDVCLYIRHTLKKPCYIQIHPCTPVWAHMYTQRFTPVHIHILCREDNKQAWGMCDNR